MTHVCGDEIWRGQTPVAASTAFSASCTVFWDLERLDWRPLWPGAERMLRKRTSLALKKATMKGCLSWGPLPVNSPASWGLLLWPTGGDRDQQGERDLWEFKPTTECNTHLSFYLTINCSSSYHHNNHNHDLNSVSTHRYTDLLSMWWCSL